jgi:cation:H+ antiporter
LLADLLLLLLGLVLLVGGGDALVRGASAMAYRLGISPLVVGLTVVAFGTSAPELAVNMAGALSGRGELSFGNVMGSNIANVGLVVGATALIRPLALHRAVIVREIPMMSLAALAALVMSLDRFLSGGAADTVDQFSRGDGLMFLLLFGVFLYYTINDALRQRSEMRAEEKALARMSLLRAVLLFVFGLAALVAGGQVTVDAASSIALALGMTEAVVGLTVVAVGTSLPELVTSMVGAFRGEQEIAVGNIVGSNIFNLLFVLGTTSTTRPLPVPARGTADVLMVIALSVILLPLSFNPERSIPRKGGVVLLLSYVGYLSWRALST